MFLTIEPGGELTQVLVSENRGAHGVLSLMDALVDSPLPFIFQFLTAAAFLE